MTLTVISHIFNEQYLLPFWLQYHSKIFDHGIIIDYYSTDNSIKIIQKYCPTWTIIKTRNLTPDGQPLFDAQLVDNEVIDIEKTVSGFKIALNTTEWFLFLGSKDELLKTLITKHHYHLACYSVVSNKLNFFPENIVHFLTSINRVKLTNRGSRILHNELWLDYQIGRHCRNGQDNNVFSNNMLILWTGFYPHNTQILNRKLQIQQNIPLSDKMAGLGFQHIVDTPTCEQNFMVEINTCEPIQQDKYAFFCKMVENALNIVNNNIYYSELFVDCNWGEDKIILNSDINLLEKTDFDKDGYRVFDIQKFNDMLKEFLIKKIFDITDKQIILENYHNVITDDEHTKIINSMPYKIDELVEFSAYITNFLSNEVKENLKVFNDDIWYRICRPNIITEHDNNPCHRDIYLDFYKNVVNIYLPIVGSDSFSSLSIEPGSHKWNENETMITNEGATFKYTDKKYSVHAVVASKQPLNMIRPNPNVEQVISFSPYLIHGCATNLNQDTTRISLEMRFIKNDDNGIKQEEKFNEFLQKRNWR
jgi:hypothetical protein